MYVSMCTKCTETICMCLCVHITSVMRHLSHQRHYTLTISIIPLLFIRDFQLCCVSQIIPTTDCQPHPPHSCHRFLAAFQIFYISLYSFITCFILMSCDVVRYQLLTMCSAYITCSIQLDTGGSSALLRGRTTPSFPFPFPILSFSLPLPGPTL